MRMWVWSECSHNMHVHIYGLLQPWQAFIAVVRFLLVLSTEAICSCVKVNTLSPHNMQLCFNLLVFNIQHY